MDTIESLKDVFENLLALKLPDFGPDTSPADVVEWDSPSHVMLILAIESRFGVEFTPAELGKLTSVGAIRNLIESKRDA